MPFIFLILSGGADETNCSFDGIYTMLDENALLGDKIPQDYARDWKLASAETLAPQL